MTSLIADISNASIQAEGPLPLQRDQEYPTDFPLDALKGVLGDAAKVIHESVQCPAAIAGQSVLAAASLAVQPLAILMIDGRTCPLSLFLFTVAESGDRKSAADTLALKPHKEYQKELFEVHKEEMKDYQNEYDVYKVERDKILKNKHLSLDERASQLDQLIEPNTPIIPTLIVQEPTLEGLHKSFASGRSSQGLFNDEAGLLFGGHAMNADNALKFSAGLSKIWDGDDIIRTRAAVGESFTLFDKRLTVHLMAQPVVAEGVLGSSMMQGQGFLPRFLISSPDSIAGSREYSGKNALDEPAMCRYCAAMRSILEIPLPEWADLEEYRYLSMEPSAKQKWISAYNAIEQEIAKGGEYENIRATASKAAENIARIAGVLTLFEDPKAMFIPLDQMNQAISLGNYYLNEALRLQGRGKVNEQLRKAEGLLEWLRLRDSDKISLPEVYQKSPRPLNIRSARNARQTMKVLEDHRWVEFLPAGAVISGKKCRDVWRVSYAKPIEVD